MTYSNLFGDNKPTAVKSQPLGLEAFQNLNNPVSQPLVLSKPSVEIKLKEAQKINSDLDVSEFGTKAGKEVAALADEVLKKTTTGKMGDFGDGITEILKLTSSVKVDDLNIDKNKGLIGKVVGMFKDKKVEVLAQFDNTSKSIEKIATDLAARQAVMRLDNEFLEKLYVKNQQEHADLGDSVEAAEAWLVQMNANFVQMQAEAQASTDQFQIQKVNEYEQRIKRWEKQIDRLKRMQHVALLTAPEIRMIQSGNVEMVEKFSDLQNTTLPAWKKQLSMTILALRQKDNAALGESIDDKTNAFFKKAAELNNQNAIAVAKSSQRSVVDIETLEFMQNQLIDSVKQVKAIQEQGREDRKNASVKLDSLRNDMKAEMLSWGK